ncbi:23S rRNA (pseudouridine(1915)-N(3))-methyltransferase RlmH, partial [Rhodovulum sulfidophilum]|nr:23S rRNA (pseudouridine(1915)-N(3))-methyltransferase RlmH [Rhodovulum sulfidophilum]
LTACKPISDDDLGRYMALCLEDPALRNRILPIGGPGPALTPRAQAEMLFRLMGRPPKIRQVPVALLDAIIAVLSLGGLLLPSLRDKADLAMSFGRMVWPHMLVRVMLAEQLYRAATILAGSPYHRV